MNDCKLSRFVSKASLAILITGCSIDDSLTYNKNDEWDLGKSSIVFRADAFADGQERYLLQVKLIGKSGEPITRRSPKLVSTISGLTFDGCTDPTDKGMTYCIFRSTVAGEKPIELNIGRVVLQTEIEFKPLISSKSFFRIANSKEITTNDSGYTIDISSSQAGAARVLSGGYKVDFEVPLRSLDD